MKTHCELGVKLVVIVCLLGSYAWAAPSAAERLAGKCPDGTFAFVATSGFDQLDPAFDQSSIGRLWNGPEVQTFVTQIKDSILTALEKGIAQGDPQAGQMVPTIKTLMEEVFACPRLAGISDIAGDSNQEFPYRIFVMIEGQTHKEQIKTSIEKIEGVFGTEKIINKPMGNFTFHAVKESEVPVVWGWYRDTFVFLVNDENGDTLKGLRLQTPKPTPLSKLTNNGDIAALYCDVQKFSSMITNIIGTIKDDSAAPQQEVTNNLSEFKTVLQMLGLNNVKSLTLRAGFDRKDVIVEKWLEVPALRTGLFTAIKPLDLTLLDKVDSRATTVMSFNIDTAGMYDLIMQIVDQLAPSPEHRDKIHSAIAGMEGQWNVKLREGFLHSLNGPMIGYSFPAMTVPQSPMGGFVLTAKLKDSALFTQNMQGLGQAVSAMFQGESQKGLTITSQPLDSGLTATAWMFPQAALLQVIPNWVIVDDCVVISSHPAITNMAVTQSKAADPGKTSIRSLTSFAMMQSKLPKNLVYLHYSNTAVNAKQGYVQLQQLWPIATAGASGQGIMLPAMLPNIQDKFDQLGQSWSYAWMDETGIRSRYQGSGAEVSIGSVAGAAMGVAIVMPALSKTKNIAQRVVSGTNLKGIGIACILYANDHDDQFPPNLEILVKDYDLAEKTLISPKRPADAKEPSYI
ncbi:MAG: hypothetical protein JXB18_10060, partial [Sedimentisphaerales bacterium]|nr:hypothetical protein [Sedimentisphaerales bacterium]